MKAICVNDLRREYKNSRFVVFEYKKSTGQFIHSTSDLTIAYDAKDIIDDVRLWVTFEDESLATICDQLEDVFPKSDLELELARALITEIDIIHRHQKTLLEMDAAAVENLFETYTTHEDI